MTSRNALRKRASRVADGRRQREEEAAATASIPTQGQLMLPLLAAIERQGGRARPRDLYEDVADQLQVPAEAREQTATFADGRESVLFERQVRWARQTAILRGHIAAPSRGIWELTAGGRNALRNVRRGVIVTVFETEAGVAVAANVEDAAGLVEPGSVDLLFTSPPFPLLSGRQYGTSTPGEWLEWMTGLVRDWRGLLAPTGSMIFHLGECRHRGAPTESAYIERFVLRLIDDVGLHLAGRLFWQNPARLPNLQWAAIRRVRVRSTVEPVLWFSRSEHCKADNRRVLVPYAASTRQRYLGRKAEPAERPSGLAFGAESWSRDNGGRIPGNLVEAANAPSMDSYARACRAAGLPVHPARMPRQLAEFAVGLTTEPGDLVCDPFLGSGTTAAVAEAMGRRWLGFERSLDYLRGAAFRFGEARGFRDHQQEVRP